MPLIINDLFGSFLEISKFMILYSKRKRIVKYIDSCLHDETNAYRYRTYGVPENDLRDYIFGPILKKLLYSKISLLGRIKSFFINKYFFNPNEITEYINYCLDENYITLNYGCLRVSSKGKKFISMGYPLIYIWKNWLEPYIFPAMISLLVSALFWWLKK